MGMYQADAAESEGIAGKYIRMTKKQAWCGGAELRRVIIIDAILGVFF